MNRRIVAVFLAPLGSSLGAWLGQYLIPGMMLESSVTVVHGVTYGVMHSAPASLLLFLFPNKLTVPLAAITYLVVLLLGWPLTRMLSRHGKATVYNVAEAGVFVGLGLTTLLVLSGSNFLGMTHRSPQVFAYGSFVGAVCAAWFWVVGYAGEVRRVRSSLSDGDHKENLFC